MSPQESMINGYNALRRNAAILAVTTIGLLAAGEYKPTEANAIPVPVNPATYTPQKGETPVDFTDPSVLTALDKMNNDPARINPWQLRGGVTTASPIDAGRYGPYPDDKPKIVTKDGLIFARLNTEWLLNYIDTVGDAKQTVSLQAKGQSKNSKFKTIGKPATWRYGLSDALSEYTNPGDPQPIELQIDVPLSTLNKYKKGELRLKDSYSWNFNEDQTFEEYLTVNNQGQDEITQFLPKDGRFIPENYKNTKETSYSRKKPVKTVVASIRKSAKRK